MNQVCLHKIGARWLGKLTICIDNAGPLRGHCIVAMQKIMRLVVGVYKFGQEFFTIGIFLVIFVQYLKTILGFAFWQHA